jgi:Eco57I restriction-modification methylase
MNNTAQLKSFATASRTSLIAQMRARIAQLLTDPHAELEYRNEIKALRAEVKAHGEDGVAEIAAYTWFNRLTAARYMDANGFSGLYGVVSPEAGSASALPEILTRAQAGEFPEDFPEDVRSTATDVLTGGRVSANADLEAYGLLLGAVFCAWHQPMPEVFPAAVDWIRLLTPPDILAQTSVRARAVDVMDAEACANVEVVGWLYQFYNAELKEQINDSKLPIDAETLAPVTQLFTPHWIVRYLVENSLGRLWLRSRPSSRLRDRMDYYVESVAGQQDTGVTVRSPEEIRVLDPACGSGHMLTYAFDLLYAIYEEEGYTPSSIPELILTHNLRGLEIDERAAQLALFALAMKARARDRRFLQRKVQPDIIWVRPVIFDQDAVQQIVQTVTTQSRADGSPVGAEAVARLLYAFVDADSFGSLIRIDPDAVTAFDAALDTLEKDAADLYTSHNVAQVRELVRQAKALVDNQYHVVVTNPPYLGTRNMGTKLSEFAKKQFPETKSDLYAMFIERNAQLALPAASTAMITMHSWMFLSSYTEFRSNLPSRGHLSSMAHLGTRAFDSIGGERVQTAAFVIDVEPRPKQHGVFLRLVDDRNEAAKDEALRGAVGDSRNSNRFIATMNDFAIIPEAPIVYWLSDAMKDAFARNSPLGRVVDTREGMATGDNDKFLREWFEVCSSHFSRPYSNRPGSNSWSLRWYPYQKGGDYRKWYGNVELVVDWQDDGARARLNIEATTGRVRSHNYNGDFAFVRGFTWNGLSSGGCSARVVDQGYMFDARGPMGYPKRSRGLTRVVGLVNSEVGAAFLEALSPTIDFKLGHLLAVPYFDDPEVDTEYEIVEELVSIFRADWNNYETSWDFRTNSLVDFGAGFLKDHARTRWDAATAATRRAQDLEQQNNLYFAGLYHLLEEVDCDVPLSRISLTQNPYFRYAPTKGVTRREDEYQRLFFRDVARELISYGVGCIMGRYSIDKPGLILADAGSTIADFDRQVPNARFRPDADGILPITAEQYFEDDIVTRLREFLTVAFGPANLEANIVGLETALGSGKRKSLRDYFLNDFYTDHVKTYSKRPIYWQVCSPRGGFSALFYLHRYTPSTLGIIHQNFAEELLDKLEARLDTIEHALPTADKREAIQLSKERDAITAQRREIRDWIDTSLFPLASTEMPLDLDDGVKHNYPKLAGVVKKVTGL